MTMNTRTFAAPLARGTVALLLFGCGAGCDGDGKAVAPSSNVAGAPHSGGTASEGQQACKHGWLFGRWCVGRCGASAGGASAGASRWRDRNGERRLGAGAQSVAPRGQATGGAAGSGGMPADYVPISFGTTLDPAVQARAKSQGARAVACAGRARPCGGARKATSTAHSRFAEANEDVPYRLCVPDDWDGTSELPLVMFLHGANNDEKLVPGSRTTSKW